MLSHNPKAAPQSRIVIALHCTSAAPARGAPLLLGAEKTLDVYYASEINAGLAT